MDNRDDIGDGYNETLSYGAYTGGDVSLVTMTLDRIDALQIEMLVHPKNYLNSSAIGRYQIVRTTLRAIRKKLKLTGSELYDVAMQDRLCRFLLGSRGIDRYCKGEMTERAIMNALAKEWASLPQWDGSGHYGGQRARATVTQVRIALEETRRRFLTAEQPAPDPDPAPVPAEPLPVEVTPEIINRLAARSDVDLASAAQAIALAQAVKAGWNVNAADTAQIGAHAVEPALFNETEVEAEGTETMTNLNDFKSRTAGRGQL